DEPQGTSPISRLFAEQLDPRLAANGLRLIGLERKLKALKARLHEAEKIDPEGFIKELDARVSHVEGTHCAKKEFQCGGYDQECISDLFVCDGHKDCHNGHDEAEDVCDTSPVKPGNIFSGTSHWHDCLLRSDHVTRVVIKGTIRRNYFKSRIWVRAQIESDLIHDGKKELSDFDSKGYYNFANRRLVLIPIAQDDKHLSVICDFDRGDSRRASCHRVLEGTLHQCANLSVHLQGHH
uniref:Linker L2 n=1 Tax=Glossoscolex paulistus TaxID=1046353 RepID=A0A0M3KKY0_9ANNE|nr:Chain N, Linker L2 [Glossoscolex paulistus]4U8U_c Chain c, Linker L2 [Glossoscolex paulistus]4U8U_r Chain r, Linker L2 [Glossoscolex paulistus]